MVTLVVILYLICGVIAAGIILPFIQSIYTDSLRRDIGASLLLGFLGGPFSLVFFFFVSGFCETGWRLWREQNREDK